MTEGRSCSKGGEAHEKAAKNGRGGAHRQVESPAVLGFDSDGADALPVASFGRDLGEGSVEMSCGDLAE
jgi:hypothetical protein